MSTDASRPTFSTSQAISMGAACGSYSSRGSGRCDGSGRRAPSERRSAILPRRHGRSCLRREGGTAMELKEAIGRRRSMRFLRPYKPVEREKIQKMLEAARLASFWGNVQALGAVVIERATAPAEVLAALPVGTAIGGFQFRLAPVVIVWTLDWSRVDAQGERLHELAEVGAVGVHLEKTHAYLDATLIAFFQAAVAAIKQNGLTELDCGQGIAQATLVAYEEGLGTCLLGCPNDRKLRRALGLPDAVKVLVLQTVGYPAEDPESGGQRPRLPFE